MNEQYDILSLAEQKCFDLLSQKEQNFVLQEMPKLDFDELHQSIQTSQQFFESQKIEVSSMVKPRLDQAFQMKYAREKRFWMQRSIPIWQAVAACFFVALISWAFLNSNAAQTMTETVYVYQTDTIFQDAPIVNESPQQQTPKAITSVPKKFPTIAKHNQKPSKAAAIVSANFEWQQMPKVNDSVVVFQTKMGQSVKDDTLLMNWGGVIF